MYKERPSLKTCIHSCLACSGKPTLARKAEADPGICDEHSALRLGARWTRPLQAKMGQTATPSDSSKSRQNVRFVTCLHKHRWQQALREHCRPPSPVSCQATESIRKSIVSKPKFGNALKHPPRYLLYDPTNVHLVYASGRTHCLSTQHSQRDVALSGTEKKQLARNTSLRQHILNQNDYDTYTRARTHARHQSPLPPTQSPKSRREENGKLTPPMAALQRKHRQPTP